MCKEILEMMCLLMPMDLISYAASANYWSPYTPLPRHASNIHCAKVSVVFEGRTS